MATSRRKPLVWRPYQRNKSLYCCRSCNTFLTTKSPPLRNMRWRYRRGWQLTSVFLYFIAPACFQTLCRHMKKRILTCRTYMTILNTCTPGALKNSRRKSQSTRKYKRINKSYEIWPMLPSLIYTKNLLIIFSSYSIYYDKKDILLQNNRMNMPYNNR